MKIAQSKNICVVFKTTSKQVTNNLGYYENSVNVLSEDGCHSNPECFLCMRKNNVVIFSMGKKRTSRIKKSGPSINKTITYLRATLA